MTDNRRLARIAIATLLVCVIARPAPASDTADARGAKALLAKGDRAADREDYAEAVLLYKQAYDLIVPELRGLPFKQPVEARLMTRDELRDSLVDLIDEELPEAEMILFDRSLKAFGFIPKDSQAKSTMLELLTEEIGGYYNPKTKKIALISEVEDSPRRTLVEWVFGAGPAFAKDEQRAALAHEMAHALADQHFDLEAMHEAVKDDDDLELALAALIEGEAMIVMIAEMLRETGDSPQLALFMPPGYIDFSFGMVKSFLPFLTGKAFRSAPPIFRESLTFPYFKGMVFVLHLTNRGQWPTVNRAFRHPPLSTEQILHPEKYRDEIDVPTAIQLPTFDEILGNDWTRIGENVLGEFQISVLLRRHRGASAAAGWDGDRYAVYEDDDGKLGLIWYSTWDTTADAHELAAAYARYLLTKLDSTGDDNALLPEESSPTDAGRPITFRVRTGGRCYHVERRGADVLVVEGFGEPTTDQLLDRLQQVETSEKQFPEIERAE